MPRPPAETAEQRVLVLAPFGRDGRLICDILRRADLRAQSCETIETLCEEIRHGGAAAVMTEEILTDEARAALSAALSEQPTWSDFPLLVLASQARRKGDGWTVPSGIEGAGLLTLLDRPLRTASLLSAVLGAVKSRQRQYQVRDELVARQQAERAAEAARAEAEAANRAKSQFLANMSHELRTPMNAILGMTDLALRAPLPDVVRDQLQTARDSGAVLLDLLNDLLDFSRIESGRLELEQCPFALRDVVGQVVATLEVRAAEKGLELKQQIAPGVPDGLLGDPLRVRQVLTNLLSNAIKFTDEGEVAVVITLQSHQDDAVTLQFAVHDTGEGISREEQQRIFSPFTQADASTTRRHGGSGLGLAIVRSLVEKMGGRVRVESQPGRGSTFSFSLRLRRANQPVEQDPATPEPTAAAVCSSRSLRILLVEDRPANQQLVGYLLSDRGHQHDVAANGREAVEQVLEGEYDVVLMDVQMPEMDGLEASRRIRRLPDPKQASVPIIAMTAHALEGDAQRCLGAGMNAYLSKPIDADRLLELVESLGGSRESTHDQQKSESERRRPAFGSEIFDAEKAIHTCYGREHIFRTMAEEFLGEADRQLAELRAAVDHQDADTVQTVAHRLKNSVIFLGASAAEEATERVDRLGRRGDLAEAPAAIERLGTQIEKLKQALRAHLADDNGHDH